MFTIRLPGNANRQEMHILCDKTSFKTKSPYKDIKRTKSAKIGSFRIIVTRKAEYLFFTCFLPTFFSEVIPQKCAPQTKDVPHIMHVLVYAIPQKLGHGIDNSDSLESRAVAGYLTPDPLSPDI